MRDLHEERSVLNAVRALRRAVLAGKADAVLVDRLTENVLAKSGELAAVRFLRTALVETNMEVK